MVWLFASVVLLLLVFHPGFRKFALWLGSIVAVLVAFGLAVSWWKDSHPPHIQSADELVPPRDLPPPPPGFTLDCPIGQQPAKDARTGRVSCYDPNDPAQLAQHLKECAPTQHIVWDIDHRGIPCVKSDSP